MFDKLLFNNQLITNKKKALKAKTICINKLVQKIRKVKSLQEKKADNADKKLSIKIDKITETIQCLQKIKSGDILKRAILYNKNPNSIITNGLALPEEIAEALLFAHKIIIDIVSDIKEKCQLNSKNPKWREKIQELSKKQQKLKHKTHVQEKIETRKIQKELKRKRNEWLEENLLKEEQAKLNDENHPEWKELPLEPIDLSIEIICPKSKLESINKRLNKRLKTENNVKTINKVVKEETSIENNISGDQEENLEIIKTEDSFFLTNTGNNYLSTVHIDRVQPERPDDGMIRKDRRKFQKNNPINNKMSNKKNTFKMHSIENGKIMKNNTKAGSFNNNKPNIKKEISENPLHPSWAAKQKQKTIQQFSGKKIVFDEDTNGKESLNNKNNVEKIIENKTDEKLHPSWAAKQKLKPKISEFQGKKITFDIE